MERLAGETHRDMGQLTEVEASKSVMPMIFTLVFFGSCVYKVTNLREVFYTQMQGALALTNTQIGLLSSVVGVTSVVSNLLGGYLADRYSIRSLVMLAAYGSAGLTLVYMLYPPFPILVLVHIGITMCGMLLFWSAYVRMVRLLGHGQKNYYGQVEGLRSFLGLLIPLGATGLVTLADTVKWGLRFALFYYTVCFLITALLAQRYLPKAVTQTGDQLTIGAQVREYGQLFKQPTLYLVVALIFGTYTVFGLMSYTTPYMTTVLHLPTGVVSVVAILRQYGLGCLSMPLFGWVSVKMKSAGKACLLGLSLTGLSVLALIFSHSVIWLIVMAISLIGFFDNAVRGIYFATQDEAGLPRKYAGVAAGVISSIGFSPDIFSFMIVGRWLDKYPEVAAYKFVWWAMLGALGIAILAGIGILKMKTLSRHA